MASLGEPKLRLRMSYDRLWSLLRAQGMQKQDLQARSGISSGTVAKLGKGENLQTDTLLRICQLLDCNIADICEAIPVTPKGDNN